MSDKSFKAIFKLVESIQQVARQAHAGYAREVDAVIHEQCCDPQRIEHLLDEMLDFCFDSNMLDLYKKLCRYYFTIAPEITVSYVGFYRDLWDNNDEETH